MAEVIDIFPANKFSVAADNAASELECGLIIGYDNNGELLVYGGGILDGKQPVSKDWLWMLETVRYKLIRGDYHD